MKRRIVSYGHYQIIVKDNGHFQIWIECQGTHRLLAAGEMIDDTHMGKHHTFFATVFLPPTVILGLQQRL
jgi:hypothetical protein